MAGVFVSSDVLLRQVGMVMLYYHLFRVANKGNWTAAITRKKLIDFDKLRESNRAAAERGKVGTKIKVDFDLLDFDSYAQSPNDAGALKFRLGILLARVFKKEVPQDLL